MHIAIIGGGFSGVMLAVNLIRQGSSPLRISLFDKSPVLAKGTAYGTQDPYHLLNVRAARMGAFAEDPENFYHWLVKNEASWRALHPAFEILEAGPELYLPRMIYGSYLEDVWKESLQLARQKGINVFYHQNEIVKLEKNPEGLLSLSLSDGTAMKADKAVLAIGVPSNRAFPAEKKLPDPLHYISNMWNAMPESIFKMESLKQLSSKTTIVIAGSGLTMLDAFASLVERGFRGRIIAISRLGRLPAVHVKHVDPYPNFIDLKSPPGSALQLLKCFRREIKKAMENGVDWRCVIDEFRLVLREVWEQIPWDEKRKAVRHLLNIWNYHRHRMPWHYLEEIQSRKAAGTFNLLRGTVLSIEQCRQSELAVHYRKAGGREVEKLKADYVINCSGPDMNISNHSSQLVQNLIEAGYILPDPLNLGIQADRNGEVKGAIQGQLFALGQILFGERLETTSVPELRIQCNKLAKHLLEGGRMKDEG